MGIDCSNCFSSNKKAQTNSTLLVRAADDQISFGKIPSHLEKSHLQRAMTTPVSTSHPQKQKKVTLEMFKFLKEVGQGAYGKVYKVQNTKNGRIYALKKLSKKRIIDSGHMNNLLSTSRATCSDFLHIFPNKAEKNVLMKADNPFVVKLHYSFQNEKYAYLVMDFLGGGTLQSRLKKVGRLPVEAARFYAAEILLGIQYLHDKLDVIYRDLKPDNILLDEQGHVVLSDFGLSKVAAIGFTFCGTPEYLAPEMVEKKGHGKPVDLWCYGCLLHEMLVGHPLFTDADGNRERLYQRILTQQIEFPDDMDADTKDLLRRLLQRNPIERLGYLSIEEIKRHPFFAPIQSWDQVYKKRLTPPYRPGQEAEIQLLSVRTAAFPIEDLGAETPMAKQLSDFSFDQSAWTIPMKQVVQKP